MTGAGMVTFFELYWRSLIAGAVVGAAAPAIGAFVVQKRLSLIGEGIGHIAFAGVAVGLWLQVSPLGAGIVFAILGAVAIDRLRGRSPEQADMALALFFYGAIAAAVFVASLTGSFNIGLLGFLFGQLLTVTTAEMLLIGGLAAVVLAAIAGLYRGLMAVAVDEEAARVSGLPVAALNGGLMVLTAATVGVGMSVVGILLIAALMVLPVGAAGNLVRSFRATLLVASLIGAGSVFAGVAIAFSVDAAPSGAIVLVAAGCYIAADVWRILRARIGRRAG